MADQGTPEQSIKDLGDRVGRFAWVFVTWILALTIIHYSHSFRLQKSLTELEFRAAVDPIAAEIARRVEEAEGDFESSVKLCANPPVGFRHRSVYGMWSCQMHWHKNSRSLVGEVYLHVETDLPFGSNTKVGSMVLYFNDLGLLTNIERVRGRPELD